MMTKSRARTAIVSSLLVCLLLAGVGLAQQTQLAPDTRQDGGQFSSDVLSPEKREALDAAIKRALLWLSKQQQSDGSFPTLPSGQPAISSLAVMAFLSAGHQPGEGEYGSHLKQGIDFVLATQRDDGLFSFAKPTANVTNWHQATHTAMYNHAIAGLMLCESYGLATEQDLEELTAAIEKGLQITYQQQRSPGPYPKEKGGWRYLKLLQVSNQGEADLSVTGWHMMFLRSAANAGFDVPEKRIEAAADYVKRCFNEENDQFMYGIIKADRRTNRGMTGAGILSLSMAGQHQSPQARRAGDWLLKHPIDQYNKTFQSHDRFHYGVHYTSHAMYQLGGKYWRDFYPTLADTMLSGQLPSGAWPRDATGDGVYGNAYTTALAVLSLTPDYQLLPIYQR